MKLWTPRRPVYCTVLFSTSFVSLARLFFLAPIVISLALFTRPWFSSLTRRDGCLKHAISCCAA